MSIDFYFAKRKASFTTAQDSTAARKREEFYLQKKFVAIKNIGK